MMIFGPTFAEMLHPWTINPETRAQANRLRHEDPLHPINLFNITWRDAEDRVYHVVLPPSLTGVDCPIAVIYGREFPSGSHKVGAAYSVLLEKELLGEVDPYKHTLVWPSTGNYGIGGAWVGCRMAFNSLVILPEEMSTERFEQIQGYGAEIIRTPGSESNVKEIYNETWRLRESDPNIRILNQFEVMGNYRFHYYVTGNTIAELASELANQGIGNGQVAAFVSAMGSGGTIAAGDRLKQIWPEHKIIGLEPIQCPTLYNNGYGAHDIQGIGDKHVTWIHNVLNMDALMCIDDWDCKLALQVFAEDSACETLERRYGIERREIERLRNLFGISSLCNIFGAIKTARHYKFSADDLIVTVATDALDRYHSVMRQVRARHGALDEATTVGRIERLFHGLRDDWVQEGNSHNRERWHNLKYYTWVEQQGKTLAELEAQRDMGWWLAEQERVTEIDRALLKRRNEET